MKIDLTTRIVRSEDPVSAPVEDELVMADVDSGKYYALNNVSTAIWRGIEHARSVKDLCHSLLAEYNVTEEKCEAEVLQFVNKLYDKGLIKLADKS
jgi:hypothetical protein